MNRSMLLRVLAASTVAPACASARSAGGDAEFAAIERRSGGRLGVCARDVGSGRTLVYRAEDRFPMCSTWKALAAGALLARIDAGRERLDRRVAFGPTDLVAGSPITTAHAGGNGMTLAELATAMTAYSDNTAANLVLTALGGPAELTAYLRGIGDGTTRLDRDEPSLNTAIPGDPRDTTTAAAMVRDLDVLSFGDALAPASRAQLESWLAGCTTGGKRLRAGFPATWAIGDKTGTGEHGATNDVAVVRPPGRAPLVVAAYLAWTPLSADARSGCLAEVGRVVARRLGGVTSG